MIKGEDDSKVVAMPAFADRAQLPYTVELWNLPRSEPERIIGRAASAVVARAIFVAAQSEHLGRKLVLRRGSKVVAESS